MATSVVRRVERTRSRPRTPLATATRRRPRARVRSPAAARAEVENEKTPMESPRPRARNAAPWVRARRNARGTGALSAARATRDPPPAERYPGTSERPGSSASLMPEIRTQRQSPRTSASTLARHCRALAGGSGPRPPPPPRRRATAKSPAPPTPAATILPSGCSRTARATSTPPKPAVALPPVANAPSRAPAGVKRAIAKSSPPALAVPPARTIAPSGCSAAARPTSCPPKSTVVFPPAPNEVSRPPLGLSRAIGKIAGTCARRRVPGEDRLAVGLHHHRIRTVISAEVERDLAARAEGRVDRAIGIQPRGGEVVPAGARRRVAGDDDPAIGLKRRPAGVVIPAEVDDLVPAVTDGRIDARRSE